MFRASFNLLSSRYIAGRTEQSTDHLNIGRGDLVNVAKPALAMMKISLFVQLSGCFSEKVGMTARLKSLISMQGKAGTVLV